MSAPSTLSPRRRATRCPSRASSAAISPPRLGWRGTITVSRPGCVGASTRCTRAASASSPACVLAGDRTGGPGRVRRAGGGRDRARRGGRDLLHHRHRARRAVAGGPDRRRGRVPAGRQAGADVRPRAASPARPASPGCTTTCSADPTRSAVLLSVELCSLTVQRDDRSMANLVASGLFGDGAAAVVAVGAARGRPALGGRAAGGRHPQPPVPGHRAHHGLGHRRGRASGSCWTPRCPTWCEQYLGADIRDLLADHGLTVGDVGALGFAPGRSEGDRGDRGRARAARGRPGDDLAVAGRGRQPVVGSVLHVLRDTLRERPPRARHAREC